MAYSIKWGLKLGKNYALNRVDKRRAEKIWFFMLKYLSYVPLLYLVYFIIVYSKQFDDIFDIFFIEKYVWVFWSGALVYLMFLREKFRDKRLKEQLPIIEEIKKKKNIYIEKYFTDLILHIIDLSIIDATKKKVSGFYPLFLLKRMMKLERVMILFTRLAISTKTISNTIDKIIKENKIPENQREFSLRNLAHKSFDIAVRKNLSKVTELEVMEALVETDNIVKDLLIDYGISDKEIKGAIEWIYESERIIKKKAVEVRNRFKRTKHWKNQIWTSTVTPLLDTVGRDLTQEAMGFYPLVGREDEMKQIFNILESDTYGIILVGEQGVGITKIIEGIAQKIITRNVPKSLFDKRVLTMSVGKVLALSQGGKVKKIINQLIYEIQRSGNIILVLEDLPSILSVNTEDASIILEQLLLEIVNNKNVVLIGSADHETYKQTKSPLVSAMQVVEIDELSENETLKVLQNMAPYLELEYGVFITYQSLFAVVELSKYLHDLAQPAQSVRLLRQICQMVSASKNKLITKEIVQREISKMANLPLQTASGSETDVLVNLENIIYEKYINQSEAVSAVASSLRRARADITNKKRPIGTFLFLGPTGVGKTYLAKRLSEIYFNSEDRMIRLDMSEYQETQAIRNLIGAPKGTTDTSDEGVLIESLKKNPFSVILLDEFEKAHPDVHNIFLQIMEDGRLTSSKGIVYDFTHTIIIATSNAGAVRIQELVESGKDIEYIKETLKKEELNKYFKPELLNRFDNIVVFKPLSYEHIKSVAKILLDELVGRFKDKGIDLEYSKTAIETLSEEGYNSTQGARPLKRVIQNKIEDKIAKLILSNELRSRDKIVLDDNLDVIIKKAKHYF